jgi:tetratricopeptide (TPR) repeat protein
MSDMTAAVRFTGALTACLLLAGWSASPAEMAEQTPAQTHTHMHDDRAIGADQEIGTVDFRVSCDDAVRQRFDRALGLMHHMMYEQARSAFDAITRDDPNCAMAHWGVATTLFQPLWGTRPSDEDLQRGWRLSERARELAPPSTRERLLVAATTAFFQDPDSAAFSDRITRWTQGMAEAYQANPDDVDTAALYALSRLTLAQTADDREPLHDEAEQILRGAWQEHPTHPGVIHYAIHATDADGRAENALDMVEVYGKIAPEVPHALHMPSHIYVRLGDWPEVIDWNRRSADAAVDDLVGGGTSHHYVHALDYLLYAHLQQGADDRAQDILEEAMAVDRHQASFVAAFHLAAMPARMAVERRAWPDAMALTPRTPDDLPWEQATWAESMTWYARGLGGMHTGDLGVARDAMQRMESLRERSHAAGDRGFATYIDVDRRILSGWIARADGDTEEAVRLMRSAAELEATVEKHPVTPGALLPPREALGDLLMDLRRPEEALEAYRASDDIWPGRYNTVLGAARAAHAAGDDAAAVKEYTRLLEFAGDSDRPGVTEARRFLDRQETVVWQRLP